MRVSLLKASPSPSRSQPERGSHRPADAASGPERSPAFPFTGSSAARMSAWLWRNDSVRVGLCGAGGTRRSNEAHQTWVWGWVEIVAGSVTAHARTHRALRPLILLCPIHSSLGRFWFRTASSVSPRPTTWLWSWSRSSSSLRSCPHSEMLFCASTAWGSFLLMNHSRW